MIRIEVGMVLRRSEIITFASASTAVTEIVMTTAGSSLAVTARAEQIPSTCTMTGLSFDKGLTRGSNDLLMFIIRESYYLSEVLFLSSRKNAE